MKMNQALKRASDQASNQANPNLMESDEPKVGLRCRVDPGIDTCLEYVLSVVRDLEAESFKRCFCTRVERRCHR